MKIIELSPGLRLASRAAWGASSKHPRLGAKVARSNRTHVFIHHTVMVDNDDSPNVWESDEEAFAKMRQLQTVRPDLGLDVPYSFVAYIMADGGLLICEGRGEDRDGAHSRGHNTAAIGISFAGNFHDRAIPEAALAAAIPLLSRFLGWLRFSASHAGYGNYAPMAQLGSRKAPNGRRVWAHRDIKATACPGDKLMKHLDGVVFIDPGAG